MMMALKDRLSKRVWRKRKNYVKLIIVLLVMIFSLAVYLISPFRFDFSSGSHRMLPVAIDTDTWGNYRVYFRTNALAYNGGDDFYYIDKDRIELAQQAARAIVDDKEIVVYCDQYIGWKGFTAPTTSPIVRIETIQPNVGPRPLDIKSLNIKSLKVKAVNLI
jgi:hypothetical protein